MKSLRKRLPFVLAVVLLLAPVACGGPEEATPAEGADLEAKLNTAILGSLDEQWELILELGREEGEVNFETWCGNEQINEWLDTFVATQMKEKYGITVNRICSAGALIDRLLAEREEDVLDANDVSWTNGWTSQQCISQDLFYGPLAYRMPNFLKYYNVNDPQLVVDFGFPSKGYETPYTRTEFTMFYDSAKVDPVPRNLEEFTQWIKDHPGRFTYPNPSVDFTGDAFMKTVFYHTNATGSHAAFVIGFDEELLESSWGSTWDWFNEIKPYLWREGETYPETKGQLEVMYQNGEVDWTMAYGPARGSLMIAEGTAPETTRGLILEDGVVANANFLAIYFNAPHKAASMVFLNFMMSPEAQLSFYDPENWGDLPTLDPDKLSPEMRAEFEAVDRGAATPSLEELLPNALPEINSAYAEPLQQGWVDHVLQAD